MQIRKICLTAAMVAIVVFIAATISFLAYISPPRDDIEVFHYPPEFFCASSENRIDYQTDGKCAAYNRAMGGSFSIKSVLPAIFPDDPALDYHNLEGVHNGSEAMSIFPKMKDMPPEEQAKARHDLLKYCELDTFAMVKVWQALCEAAE